MKFIKFLLIFTTTALYQEIQTTFVKDSQYQENCKNLQNALTIALETHRAELNIQTITIMKQPFTREHLVACRKDYESQNPKVFEENPAIIQSTGDGIILINIFTQEEADNAYQNALRSHQVSTKNND